ncbi:helix-turn-helix domain-containing protein [Glycomyces buryatensis]|uniref:Helix-turn-helix domain-containing protein n=1 Tax=Glycomyces buryatensis TaxID=2570927 RepID=A0A4S8QFR8_9ACTN|nr:helix-turn-helix transcriptional regulator [Glycomyces buryatensis]THV43547.1 helix-turn-helix domain-containing protein [Glycomyces buryatensis]
MANEKFLQRELARTLIKYRELKGLSKDEAIWFLGTSKDILNSYESGKLQFVEPAIIASWLADYGAPQAVVDDAKAKAKWIRQGNPSNWQESAPEGFAQFTEIELLAATIDIYEAAYVTGILQTFAYAAAVLATNPNLTDEQRRTALSFRMQRQVAVFERPGGPPRMRVILPEDALTIFKGTEIYDEQLAHLTKLNRLAQVEIFIVPSGQIHASRGRSYEIMAFVDEKDPEVVYQEDIFGGRYEAKQGRVVQCRKLFSATLPVVLRYEEWRASDADQ